MFKKKRLFIIACILVLIAIGVIYGLDIAAGLLVAFFALLALLQLTKILTFSLDLRALRALKPKYAWDAQIETLQNATVPDANCNFVVLGDTRNNVAVSKRLYRKAKELGPDMLFHTGDIVRSGTARELISNHIQVIEKEALPFPVFCVPGNHERGIFYNFAAYNALYGSDRFAFIHNECNFIGFNNSGKKGIGEEELQFLEKSLAQPSRFAFVFLHIPPAFFEAAFVLDSRRRGFKKNAGRFHEILCEHHVTEVFFAHIHGYASEVIDGVRYTLTGGGGAPLSRRLDKSNRHYHLINMKLTPSGIERELFFYRDKKWTTKQV